MKIRNLKTKTFIALTIAVIASVLSLGLPNQEAELSVQVESHILELQKVVNSSDGSKASFLSNGFCNNGTLEQLANVAETFEQIALVDSLSRDCVVVTELLNT